ncbi:MAG: hypothetical protein QOK37_1177 [Thermoanaerobaculia bacterium]|jgi:hypothetical protein|nr:hypothetical protein [Thermoanaerobaculia bacterium]
MFSRGFIAALAGIAMTLLAWFGPWAWPGWPAGVALDLLASFPDLSQAAKASIVVLLIIINVGTWALLVRAAMQLLPRRREDPDRATNQSGGPSSS